MADASSFYEITPDRVLAAVEAAGLPTTGRCSALNSYENRVYDVELELDERPAHPSANRRVVKFYRPGRWTEEQILEEHRFIADLVEAEIPAIAPLRFPSGGTLQQVPGSGIWFAVFPKVGGRAPDELTLEQFSRIGRLLARIHNVGAAGRAEHRVELNGTTYGRANAAFLLERGWVPPELRERYRSAAERICEAADRWMEGVAAIRLHGDCHLGNLLWSPSGPFFLDFDDMVRGPSVQDLWLLLPGRVDGARQQLEALLDGYEEMRRFDRSTLRLIEPLRALRFIHYSAWVARRWEDPAFPLAFPHFGTPSYWREQTEDLEEQWSIISGHHGS